MSGHSKWATTKHRKGAVDKARGKLFAKLIRQVEVAAREGGGDLTANATLRTMFTKARDASVPLDTIERAIKRGTGELEGVRYEAVAYEGYAPSGVALIVECLTDNRNRTGSEIRSTVLAQRRLDGRAGGGLVAVRAQGRRHGAEVGGRRRAHGGYPRRGRGGPARRRGRVDGHERSLRPRRAADRPRVGHDPRRLRRRRDGVDDPGRGRPTSRRAKRVLKLIELLEEHDDVQNVWSNFDIPDEILERVAV